MRPGVIGQERGAMKEERIQYRTRCFKGENLSFAKSAALVVKEERMNPVQLAIHIMRSKYLSIVEANQVLIERLAQLEGRSQEEVLLQHIEYLRQAALGGAVIKDSLKMDHLCSKVMSGYKTVDDTRAMLICSFGFLSVKSALSQVMKRRYKILSFSCKKAFLEIMQW